MSVKWECPVCGIKFPGKPPEGLRARHLIQCKCGAILDGAMLGLPERGPKSRKMPERRRKSHGQGALSRL